MIIKEHTKEGIKKRLLNSEEIKFHANLGDINAQKELLSVELKTMTTEQKIEALAKFLGVN